MVMAVRAVSFVYMCVALSWSLCPWPLPREEGGESRAVSLDRWELQPASGLWSSGQFAVCPSSPVRQSPQPSCLG